LALALVTRLALLGSIAWIVGLTQPLFEVFGHVVSWRYLILMGGGFFLLYKGTREIHHRLEGDLPGENELWRRHRANRAARHRALAR
jgi:predicted tellurium resistance membrane protein TerC